MKFRVISINDQGESILDAYEWFTGVTNEYTLNPAEINVEETDRMVVVCAQNNFNKAIEVGRKFYQAGVLTLGVFPEYIEEQGCFDAQMINDGKSILNIVRALTAPAIYSGPISFDFNDIRATLKDAGKFYASFAYRADVEVLISKLANRFKQIDLNKVESVCINLYGDLQPDSNAFSMHKARAISDIIPEESSVLFGIHKLPDYYCGIADEIAREMAFGISFILAGKDMRI